jgi:hypothetical protein
VGNGLQPRVSIQERMSYIKEDFNDRDSAGRRGSLLADINLSNYAGPSGGQIGQGQAAGYT